jgi:transposase InsO family protein
MTATPQSAAAKLDAMARAALHRCRDYRRDGFPLASAAHLQAARDFRASARRCRRIEADADESTTGNLPPALNPHLRAYETRTATEPTPTPQP